MRRLYLIRRRSATRAIGFHGPVGATPRHDELLAPTALMGFTPFAVLTLPAGVVDVSIRSDPPAVQRTSASIIWSRDRPRDDFITHIPMLVKEAPADHGRSLRLLGFVPADNWLAVGLGAIGEAVLPWALSSLRFSGQRVPSAPSLSSRRSHTLRPGD